MTADPAKQPSRLERALAIRRHVLPLLRANGTITNAGGMRLLRWEARPWRFAFRMDRPPTPTVQRGKPQAYKTRENRQDIQDILDRHRGANLDQALDIWYGSKVFLIEWDVGAPDRLNIAMFKEGPWETAQFDLERQGTST